MARIETLKAENIYTVVKRFKEESWIDGTSFFDSSKNIWNTEILDKLKSTFPDTDTSTTDNDGSITTNEQGFIEKFKEQLKNQELEVILLAAEILYIYFLFPSNISKNHKEETIKDILDCNEETKIDTFEEGIGSCGAGYNLRRTVELKFLINFMIKFFNDNTSENREKMLEDSKEFREYMDAFQNDDETASSVQIRHILLHLLFPDEFENIANGSHKKKIVETFAELLKNNNSDIDNQLREIRKTLEESEVLLDKPIDFYQPELNELWNDGYVSNFSGTPLDLIRYKKQIVLYGPPGTGKTFSAKKLARDIIRSEMIKQQGVAYFKKKKTEIEDIFSNNIHRLQLHPAYSYEDFIRALHISNNGGTEYRLGYFTKLINEIEKQPSENRLPHILILDEMNRTDLSRLLGECFSLLEDREQTIYLPGYDDEDKPLTLKIPNNLFIIGTMNLIDQSVEQIDFALRRRFLWIECPFDGDSLFEASKMKWKKLKKENNNLKAWEDVSEDFQILVNAATQLNKRIHESPLLGAQYEIGHTYFMDTVEFLFHVLKEKPKSQSFLWERKDGNPQGKEPIKLVWEFSIRPLLEQYLAGFDVEKRKEELDTFSKIFLTPKT